jgi:hypothetical protein
MRNRECGSKDLVWSRSPEFALLPTSITGLEQLTEFVVCFDAGDLLDFADLKTGRVRFLLSHLFSTPSEKQCEKIEANYDKFRLMVIDVILYLIYNYQ